MRPLCHIPPHLGLGVPAQRLCSTPDHSGQSAHTGRTGGAPGGRGQGQVVQLNIERETTRRELERLQEDLAVIMGRLSLGKREKG